MIALRTLRHNIEIGPGEKGLVPEAVVMVVPRSLNDAGKSWTIVEPLVPGP